MKVVVNGELKDGGATSITPMDRGFTLGDGLYETIAVRKGGPRRLAAHISRLRSAATIIDIPLTYTDEQISDFIDAVIEANQYADGFARITLTRGPSERGITIPESQSPTLVVTGAMSALSADPVHVVISKKTRRNEYSPLSGIKSTNALDSILAREEAHAAGADDALLLNTTGRLAESTVANIFLLVGGGILTPPITDGALPGIMRAEVIKMTRAEEKSLGSGELSEASEIFLTNALGIRPVLSVDGKAVGDGEPGLITQLLAARL
jgi:branched-chain amino acid aminotransferase